MPVPHAGGGGGFRGGPGGGPVARQDGPLNVMPIATLNSYQNRWAIKARCTQKSDIRRWVHAAGACVALQGADSYWRQGRARRRKSGAPLSKQEQRAGEGGYCNSEALLRTLKTFTAPLQPLSPPLASFSEHTDVFLPPELPAPSCTRAPPFYHQLAPSESLPLPPRPAAPAPPCPRPRPQLLQRARRGQVLHL